jgi:hypothetical protein
MSDDLAPSENSLTIAADKLLLSIPTITAIIVVFTGVAYLTGWLHARAYFQSFGAEWALVDISGTSILTFSWLPLAWLLFFIYLGITDLLEGGKRRSNATFYVLKYGSIFSSILILATAILQKTGPNELAHFIIIVSPYIYALVAGAGFETLLLKLQKSKFNITIIYPSYAVIVFGLYFLPTQMGKAEAVTDTDPRRSTLAKVKIIDKDNQEFRLLYKTQNYVYVVELRDNNERPAISIFELSHIKTIEK